MAPRTEFRRAILSHIQAKRSRCCSNTTPERLPAYFKTRECPQNVWLGVSVEDKKYGLPRIDDLRKVNATIRFLSVEPLLEDLGKINLGNIHWVIVGGESGPKARPMSPVWVDGIKEQCVEASVSFFFKQWGGWGADGKKRPKKKNGRLLQGRTWDDMPVKLSNVYSV